MNTVHVEIFAHAKFYANNIHADLCYFKHNDARIVYEQTHYSARNLSCAIDEHLHYTMHHLAIL